MKQEISEAAAKEKARERSHNYYAANRERCKKTAYERALRQGKIKQPKQNTLEAHGLSDLQTVQLA